jgi:aldose 1-epimerase
MNLEDPFAHTLVAGDLEAVFLPGYGMLGASLRHRNAEILRRIEDLQAAAAKGSTAGIPLLHPWANRLAGFHYRAAGRAVDLDESSPLLHLDDHGLAMHGVPWSQLAWKVIEAKQDSLAARLEWTSPDLLAIFPFRHRLEILATLDPDGLLLETTLVASTDGPVPVSFGFHPYFGLPELPRAQWRMKLPAMQSLVLDASGIPTGEQKAFDGFDAQLGESTFDDCFALLGGSASLSLAGAGRRITVEFLKGYGYAQVFAPKGKDFVALEPMTAPTSALTSGHGLQIVESCGEFSSAFRIRVEEL